MPKTSKVYALVMVLVLWQLLHLFTKNQVIPGPWESLARGASDGPVLLKHALYSLYRISLAVGISFLISVPLGIFCARNHYADALLTPLAYLFHPVPKVAFLPVLLVLFGLGNLSKIILLVFIIFFQMMLSVRDGIKQLPEEILQSMQAMRMPTGLMFKEVLLPASFSSALSALRIAIGISMAALFYGENIATSYGIGYYIMNSWVMADYPAMFAGIVVMSLLGGLLIWLVDGLESVLCPWKKEKQVTLQ